MVFATWRRQDRVAAWRSGLLLIWATAGSAAAVTGTDTASQMPDFHRLKRQVRHFAAPQAVPMRLPGGRLIVGYGYDLMRIGARERIAGINGDYEALRAGRARLSPMQMECLLTVELAEAALDCRRRVGTYARLAPARRRALIHLRYLLGAPSFARQRALLQHCAELNYERMAREVRKILWTADTKACGDFLAEVLRTGEEPAWVGGNESPARTRSTPQRVEHAPPAHAFAIRRFPDLHEHDFPAGDVSSPRRISRTQKRCAYRTTHLRRALFFVSLDIFVNVLLNPHKLLAGDLQSVLELARSILRPLIVVGWVHSSTALGSATYLSF